MSNEIVLEVRNATKRFGPVLALDSINLTARRGRFWPFSATMAPANRR